jgi:hypothetical protein
MSVLFVVFAVLDLINFSPTCRSGRMLLAGRLWEASW